MKGDVFIEDIYKMLHEKGLLGLTLKEIDLMIANKAVKKATKIRKESKPRHSIRINLEPESLSQNQSIHEYTHHSLIRPSKMEEKE